MKKNEVTPEFVWDAYLCYCAGDAATVEQIINPWISQGFRCYQDQITGSAGVGKVQLEDTIKRTRDFVLFISEQTKTAEQQVRWRLEQVEPLVRSQQRLRVVHFVLLQNIDPALYQFGALSRAIVMNISNPKYRAMKIELLARELRVPVPTSSFSSDEEHAAVLNDMLLVDLILEGNWDLFTNVDRIEIEREIAGEPYTPQSPRVVSTAPQGRNAVRITVLTDKRNLRNLEEITDKIAGKKVLRTTQARPFLVRPLRATS